MELNNSITNPGEMLPQVNTASPTPKASQTVITAGEMSGFDGQFTPVEMRKYRGLETLPEENWRHIDTKVNRTAKENLVGIADLRARADRGLVMPFNGMSASVFTMKRASEVGKATIATDPDRASESSISAFSDLSVPILVTYKDFTINTKQMTMAANNNFPLAFVLVEEATRSVARTLEDTLFNGDIPANGSRLYGYTKYPDRQTHTLPTSWTTATPDAILNDVNTMMSFSLQHNHFGPWILYIPWQYQTRLNQDYRVGTGEYTDKSIRSRLMELSGLEGIRVANYLADDSVVLVEMNSSTIILIEAMPIRALAWEPNGAPGWNHKFKVMTMSIPLVISDYKSQCGVVHGTV
jgi:uncharacterized linocin/CFP29 family protein